MSSGMTGQTRCLTSRWDKPAQPKESIDVQQQKTVGNAALPVSLPEVVGSSESNSAVSLPPGREEKPVQGGVELAAAMAAKINAMLMAKGKLLTPPPLPAKMPTSIPVPSTVEEMVVTEVDINDVPLNSRDLLTKGKTQEEIRLFSGAVVSTKGHYMTDVEKGTIGGQRPLYLHVQGKTQDQVNKAVLRIKEIISEDVMRASAESGGQQVPIIPPLTLYPQPPRPVVSSPLPRMPNTNSAPGPGHRPAAPHTGSFVHTKIFVGLDQAPASFNVKEKVEGPSGTYLTHIQTETGARIFLRGKGSGYIEQASKRESFEPLYVYISHPNAAGLESAKKLTESLLETVRAEHARMVSMYTATGSTQPYPAHGYPANSSYSSQASWYSYPANGYSGGYAAYPGAAAYWSNADGPQSNVSTNPPSSQTMVQYPVCPRKPHPYLVQDSDSSETLEPAGSLKPPPETGSPKHQVQTEQEAVEEQTDSCPAEEAAHLESPPPPPPSTAVEERVERVLMPPPPPPFVAPPPVMRKRPVDAATEDPAGLQSAAASLDEEDVCVKKIKVNLDTSGLVPYEGDSSDDEEEEEERTDSSKTENS